VAAAGGAVGNVDGAVADTTGTVGIGAAFAGGTEAAASCPVPPGAVPGTGGAGLAGLAGFGGGVGFGGFGDSGGRARCSTVEADAARITGADVASALPADAPSTATLTMVAPATAATTASAAIDRVSGRRAPRSGWRSAEEDPVS
jgi:hypothetical protein